MRDFCYVNFESKYLKTYCMSLFGSPLWELDGKNISSFYVAWRNSVRKLLSLPYNTHCVLLNLICHDTTIDNQLDRRVVKCLASCKISNNTLVKLSYNLACSGSQSAVGNNMTFLCSKYDICRAILNCNAFNYSTCISKCEMITNDVGASIKEGFRCKTHYIHLVHSEKFHVLRTTLNAFCHKSDNSALHSTADNAFCATTLLV